MTALAPSGRPAVARPARSPGPAFAPVVAGSSLLAGLIAGWLVASGRGAAVVGLAVVLLPVLLWKRPELGPAVVVGAALTIEQFPTDVGPGWATTTAGVPLFHGLDALHLAPADFLLTVLLLIAFRRGAVRSRAPVPRTATSFAFLALLSAVLLAIGLGLAHHGASRVAFMEARPYVYLAATYLLASVLVTTWSAVRAVLWAFVLGSGFKAAQGLYLFLSVRHLDPRPEAVLGHEEALFFGLFIFLTLALWLFQISGRLRLVATCLLPIVVAGDLANTRRSAWLILGGGLITLAVVGYTVLPARRRFIGRLVIVSALGLAIYLPAFWNKSGGLAQPARAVHSIVAPNARDAASDLYRIQEDANLKVNIRNAGPLGKGFGVPIDYVLPIEDISDLDPFIAYIPHDGVLYVLMRMGVLGGIAFWALLATGIIGACRLARSVDRDLAVVGALTACALVAYTMMGAVDQGFFFYRIAFVIGSLLGLAEAARRLDRTPRPVVVEPAPEPLPDVEAASQSRLRDRLSSWI